jgi:hypothetical protein
MRRAMAEVVAIKAVTLVETRRKIIKKSMDK